MRILDEALDRYDDRRRRQAALDEAASRRAAEAVAAGGELGVDFVRRARELGLAPDVRVDEVTYEERAQTGPLGVAYWVGRREVDRRPGFEVYALGGVGGLLLSTSGRRVVVQQPHEDDVVRSHQRVGRFFRLRRRSTCRCTEGPLWLSDTVRSVRADGTVEEVQVVDAMAAYLRRGGGAVD